MLDSQSSDPRNAVSGFHAHFPKNHLKRDLPQHMTATRVATEKNRVCHYMSPSILHDWCVIRADQKGRSLATRGSMYWMDSSSAVQVPTR